MLPNQTVRLTRCRRLASYAAQLITLRFCLGMWWRRVALALNGMISLGSKHGPAYPDPTNLSNGRSVQQPRQRRKPASSRSINISEAKPRSWSTTSNDTVPVCVSRSL